MYIWFFEADVLLTKYISFVHKLEEFLELTQSQFKGTVPTALGLLTDLQFLNLAHNHFSGTIPTEVGQLQRLRKSQEGGVALNRLFVLKS